jgi:hypothetical protein
MDQRRTIGSRGQGRSKGRAVLVLGVLSADTRRGFQRPPLTRSKLKSSKRNDPAIVRRAELL